MKATDLAVFGDPRRWVVLGLVAVFLCIPLLLQADKFELKDGSHFEGTIVRELGDFISVRKADGKIITFEKKDLKYHKKTSTSFDEFNKRKAALGAKDIPGRIELSEWCERKGMKKEALSILRDVLNIDPANVTARTKLGYELIGGEWFLKGSREAEAKRRAMAEAKKPKAPKQPKQDDVPTDAEPETPETGVRKRGRTGNTPLPPVDMRRLVGAPEVELKLDELVEENKPEVSLLTKQLQNFLARMEKPMRVVGEGKAGDNGYVMEIKFRVKFVKTHTFYKMKLFNIYSGVASVVFKEKKSGKILFQMPKVKENVTVNLDREEEDALGYAYSDACQAILHYVSKKPFFQKRGAKIVKLPQ